MPKVSELKTAGQIAAEELTDPGIRREHDRTALAHAVAMRVIGYRIEHGLSQTALARLLGMHQSAIARLEAGDHEPSLATLSRLARMLDIEFHIDITREVFELRDTA
jgi:ribosome-binding protein aMBF1 (putative translation factor)